MGTVQEAKAKLSAALQRARDGQAQIIGTQDPCVVFSMAEYQRLTGCGDDVHLGKWLVENLVGIGEIELPSRADNRADPFEKWAD